MENAVEALKTAAAVLIFVIAITVTFTMFSKAKATADVVTKSQDSQEYLEAAELAGTLYTTTKSASTEGTITTKGDRIVKPDDVISTIYRYNLEKYGVTIIKSDGEVVARFDSNTENLMRQYYNINTNGLNEYIETLKRNTVNVEKSPNYQYTNGNNNTLYNLYRIKVEGNNNINCGAPWYGNDAEIIKRINADISGKPYTYNNQTYNYDGGIQKDLTTTLNSASRIVEVVNEIDNSTYLKDNEERTSLLQQYELPTIEIIYILS